MIWKVVLADEANADAHDILQYTADKFGERQRDIYEAIMVEALNRLLRGPDIRGSRSRDDIAPNLRTYPLRHTGARASHVLVYRTVSVGRIDILRILHEKMDISRHVKE